MKSRVERYKSLHEKIDQSVDEKVASSGLSEFANRLNEIDHQFEPMHVKDKVQPKRAKETELEIFETFENEYLKDFLDEVKAYNVEKGYRDTSNTHQNILKELNILDDDKPEDLEELEEIEDTTLDSKAHVSVEVEPETEVSFWENYISNLEIEPELDVESMDVAPESLDNELDSFEDEVEEDVILKDEAITREILGLTAEIDGVTEIEEETVPLDDYDAPIEEVIQEDVAPINEIEEEVIHVQDESEDVTEFSDKEVRKYRFVNAMVTVALMGAVLAAAIAIKYLVLN